jgi:hypothetical protein
MANKYDFSVFLASPSDVSRERELVDSVIQEIDQTLRQGNFKARIELKRWEGMYPGMHPKGPQAYIDERLPIGDCDVLIGVFWRRFGTPVEDAESGTAHEIRRAIDSWKANGKPQVMLYFRHAEGRRASAEEKGQLRRLRDFKEQLLATDGPLVCEYKDPDSFEQKLKAHLFGFVMDKLHPSSATPGAPLSFLRVSVSAG